MVILAVAIPTLIGSICSLIAASFIFVCYLVVPFKAHFRHVLILNLATAGTAQSIHDASWKDEINDKSRPYQRFEQFGFWYILYRPRKHPHRTSVYGQWIYRAAFRPGAYLLTHTPWRPTLTLMLQGTDFSILMIAIVTVIVLKAPRYLPNTSLHSQIILSFGIWMVPLATSTTALAFGAYGPVSGNWCWIKADRADLRYALTHGWRMGIIITTIGLYAYLFFFFRQVFAIDQRPSPTSIKENDTYHIMTAMANPHQFAGSAHLPQPSLQESQITLTAMGPFELPGEELRKSLEKSRDTKSFQANHQALSELTGDFPLNELEGDVPMNKLGIDLPR
jgi:hypothetical protein